MADNNGVIGFGLDLDVKEFVKHAEEANESLKKLGETDKFKHVVEQIKHAGLAVGVLSAAILAVKLKFDQILEAEAINQINQQFENLTANAGLSANVIKNDLVKAVGGLATDVEVLKTANKALISLGSNGAKFGEIMTLARKATLVMGGDVIENFNLLSQAIANSNTRTLGTLGLKVSVQRAEENYAKSVHLLTNELTEQQKQTALLNAVLDAGQKRYGSISTEINQATDYWKQLKVILEEVGEASAISFNNLAGETVRNALGGLGILAKDFSTAVKANFLEGAEAAEARADQIKNSIRSVTLEIDENNEKLKELSKDEGIFDKVFGTKGSTERRIEILKNQLEDLHKKLEETESQIPVAEGKETAKPNGAAESPELIEQQRKIAENKAKFEKTLLALRGQRLADELKIEEDAGKAEEEFNQLKINLAQQTAAEILAINNNSELRESEKRDLRLEKEKDLNAKLIQMEQDRKDLAVNAADQYLKKSVDTMNGIGRASKLATATAQRELKDYGKQGQMVFDTFQKNAVDAFMAIGEGSKSGSDIMKGFVFGALADIAEAKGKLYLLEGFENPAALGAGAGLLILAGFLRSQAKGSSGGGGGAASAGGAESGGGAGSKIETPEQAAKPTGEPQKQKSVTLQIMGSYYETEQTKQRLLEMIRESTDATDFKYVQIGSR